MVMDDESSLDSTVNSIFDQLKESKPAVIREQKPKIEKPDIEITDKSLEKFVIEHTSRLIENAQESVEYIKDAVQCAPTPEDVNSLATMIKATASSLEVLNKIINNNKKLATSVKIKQMEIEGKKEEIEIKQTATISASREEIMKQILNKAKFVEGEIKEPKQLY